MVMQENRSASYHWRGIGEEESAPARTTRISGTWWDRAMTSVGQWLLYGICVVFAGEHILNFFRAYGELHNLSYRDRAASYGIIAMMFLFAAMTAITLAALRGYLWATTAVLIFVVARLFVQFAADDVSLGNLIELVVLLVVFGVLTQRAISTEDARDRRIADLSGMVRRLEGEIDTLRKGQAKE
jgi:hypothetical protein